MPPVPLMPRDDDPELPPTDAEQAAAQPAPDGVPAQSDPPVDATNPPDADWWQSDASASATAASVPRHDRPTAPLGAAPEPDPPPEPGADDRGGTEPYENGAPPFDEGTRELDAQSRPLLTSHASAQGLAAAALRDIGRVRNINQDSVLACLTSLPREAVDVPLGLFVVADGMGGHHGGEIASRLAIRTIVHQVFYQLVLPALDDDLTEALQPLMVGAMQEANSVIYDYARSQGSDMGTTCTAVLLLGNALYVAHVGDTRAYLLDAGGLRQLTTDHSTVGRLIQLGQLEPEAARDHPLRNQLYRTVGQQAQIQVDFAYYPLGAATHLLLCSDGLWGEVGEEQLAATLQGSQWPQDACGELIALANLAGGEDNISAIVVSLPVREGHAL